jgi:hypothetical protein
LGVLQSATSLLTFNLAGIIRIDIFFPPKNSPLTLFSKNEMMIPKRRVYKNTVSMRKNMHYGFEALAQSD